MKQHLSLKSIKELEKAAARAAENSYSPYSKFRVGAALLCEDGFISTGTNVVKIVYMLKKP